MADYGKGVASISSPVLADASAVLNIWCPSEEWHGSPLEVAVQLTPAEAYALGQELVTAALRLGHRVTR